MGVVKFAVPGKPSRWQRPGQGIDPRTGRAVRFTDKEAQAGKDWIAVHARTAFRGKRPYTGPVLVRVVAIFAIPPSWPEALKRAAREARVPHVADPDLDQLVKQVKDALRGIAYVDDNQVCAYPDSAKRYGFPERTEITISPVPQAEDEITPGQRRLEKRIATEGWDAVLCPPKKPRKDDDEGGDAPLRAKASSVRAPAPRNASKSGTKERYTPALRAAIDAALDRDRRG